MNNKSVQIKFLGACQTVTGSKFMLTTEDKNILVDCGLFQGKKELRLLNWEKPNFDIQSISCIVLTHAHLDHSGYLPLLVREGYNRPIWCTAATKDLLNLLLPDSAHLQEEEARFANLHETSKHKPAKPLYTTKDVQKTLNLLKILPLNIETELFSSISVTPTCAGHILGSTSLTFSVHKKRITFSGDIGRYNIPILPDPQPVDFGDLLICESTYGDRVHPETNIEAELAKVILQAVDKKGALLIPSFAVGRAQSLLYYLSRLEQSGDIPKLPIFVDSPMTVDATKLYRQYTEEYDDEALAIINKGISLFQVTRLKYCKTVEESKQLNGLKGARIIIAASGMITGGRILHHISQLLPKENTTILFVGFQAEGTRGHTIQSGEKEVKVFGQYVPIHATVETISGLSAHADQNELLRWLSSSKQKPNKVKIVHGEKQSTENFSQLIRDKLNLSSEVARYEEVVQI